MLTISNIIHQSYWCQPLFSGYKPLLYMCPIEQWVSKKKKKIPRKYSPKECLGKVFTKKQSCKVIWWESL